MAKTSYLNLVNRVLRRISQTAISDVTTATGHAKIIADTINEVQNELYSELNWYSLYTSRSFSTVASTSTYALAADFGRTITLCDESSNRILIEDATRSFDEVDPNNDQTGIPTHFSIVGGNYRLFPIPNGVFTIREKYWKVPTALASNTDTSDLPIECENCIIQLTWYYTLIWMNKFETADRVKLEYERLLKAAKRANDSVIDRMHVLTPVGGINGIIPPRFPSTFGTR